MQSTRLMLKERQMNDDEFDMCNSMDCLFVAARMKNTQLEMILSCSLEIFERKKLLNQVMFNSVDGQHKH